MERRMNGVLNKLENFPAPRIRKIIKNQFLEPHYRLI